MYKMDSFRKLGLSEAFSKILQEEGFENPTEIQEKAIPIALAGKDVIGASATGSGKTLAFGAAILDNLTPGNGVQSLILIPTRELAEQVGKVLQRFSRYKELNVRIVYGGVSI